MMVDNKDEQDDACTCLVPCMIGIQGNHPAYNLIFQMEKSMLLDQEAPQNVKLMDALMYGRTSRFFRFLEVMHMPHIMVHEHMYDNFLFRPLSYTKDPCKRIFNGMEDKCRKFVIAIPCTTSEVGKVWRKRKANIVWSHRVITRDDLGGAFHLALAGLNSRFLRYDEITLNDSVFNTLKKYVDEELRKGPFVIQLRDTYWSPVIEYKEFVIAANREHALIRYSPLPSTMIVSPNVNNKPLKMNETSVQQLVELDSEMAASSDAPLLPNDVSSTLAIKEEPLDKEAKDKLALTKKRPQEFVDDVTEIDACPSCNKRRRFNRAEYMPYDPDDVPLIQ